MGILERLRNLIEDIVTVIAIVLGCAAALVLMVAIIVPLAYLLSVTVPFLAAAVGAIGNFVWGTVNNFIATFKPIIESLKDLYDTWIKPTLTWVNDKVTALDTAINTIYQLSVGGVTAVYNNLFGWVDGVQTTFNRIVDNLTALVAVVDQKAADKINALRDEINTTIDKYSSDLFDKVLLKINEVAGPILIRVGEITAVFTARIDAVFGIADKLDMESGYLHDKDGFTTEDSELDIWIAEDDYAPPDEPADEPEDFVPPEDEPERSIMDAFVENHTLNIGAGGDVIMAGVEKVIDEVVEQVQGKKFNFAYFLELSVLDLDPGTYYDDLILWLLGEIEFKVFFKRHWKTIFFTPPGVETATPEELEAWAQIKRDEKAARKLRRQGFVEVE